MKRSNKTILVITLSILVVGLSIAYATLSQSLQINSSAQVAPGTWDIRTTLTSSSSPCTLHRGDGTQQILTDIHPTISGTGTITITIPQLSFSKPGEIIACVIPIHNYGTIDAKLTDIDYTATTISNLSYIDWFFVDDLGYVNSSCGEGVIWDYASPNYASNVVNYYGDYFYLQAGDTDELFFAYRFSELATTVPSSDVTLTGGQFQLNYVQSDKTGCGDQIVD